MGRHRELAVIRQALAGIGNGPPRVVGTLGEPGIGKTTLLLELAAAARRAGHLTLWGNGSELERHVPFGVFINALEDHLPPLEPERVRLLRHIFPTLAAPAGDPPAVADRYQLHRAVRSLLELIAPPSGLVIVLDDLHAIDPESVELLDHLVRNPPSGPVLLAVGYRPRQICERLRQTLTGASRRGAAQLVELPPLSAADAAGLLPAGTDAARRHELYLASGGNPFYLRILAGHGERDGLAAELAGLHPTQLRVAHAAAVLGEEFDPRLVGPVAELPQEVVLAALDGMHQRDLVRPAGPAGRFRFRHALLRQAAYQHAGAGWRLAAHGRAAGTLGERGAPVAEQAHHIELSAQPGDLDAVELLEAAAARAVHASPAAAARWLAAALRLLPDHPGTAAPRLRLLGMRAEAIGLSGDLEGSRQALDEVLCLLPAGAAAERAEVVAFRSMVDRLLGHDAEAEALLRSELDRLPDGGGPAAGVLRLAITAGGHHTEPAWVAEVVADARRTGDRLLLAVALGMSAVLGHSPAADAELDEAARVIDSLGDTDLARRLSAALWVGWGELAAERCDDAIRHVDRALRVSRCTGQNYLVSVLHTVKGVALAHRGDLAAAATEFADAAESGWLIGSAAMADRALAHGGWVRVLSGQTPTFALPRAGQATGCAPPGFAWALGSAEIALAAARYHAGDPLGCVHRLTEAGGGADLPAIRPAWRPVCLELLSAAEAAAGRPERSAAWAAQALALPVTARRPRRQGFVELAQAHPILTRNPAAALPWANAAAASFTQAGDRINAGRAHALAGVTLGTLRRGDAARERFAEARRLFATCGAHLLHDQVTRDERRMNARLPRRRAAETQPCPADRYGLTTREQNTLDLLVQGLTNRQIAANLHVSPKTVEAHLSRAYGKVGVSSRAAVAALWSAAQTGATKAVQAT